MLKKLVVLTLAFVMLSISSYAELKDLKGHWAENNINAMISRGIINGYPDGTFKPDDKIQVDQFIKLILTSDGNYEEIPQEGYWAQNYVNKAIELNLVKEGEFDTYERPITRIEMAKIMALSINEPGEFKVEDYISEFVDINDLTKEEKEYLIKVYFKGIVNGYSDGTFKPQGTGTRAEAATLLTRKELTNKRLDVDKKFIKSELSGPDRQDLDEIYSGKFIGNNISYDYISEAKEFVGLLYNVDYKNINEDYINRAMKYYDVGRKTALEGYFKKFTDGNVIKEFKLKTDKEYVTLNSKDTVYIYGFIEYRTTGKEKNKILNEDEKNGVLYKQIVKLKFYLRKNGKMIYESMDRIGEKMVGESSEK